MSFVAVEAKGYAILSCTMNRPADDPQPSPLPPTAIEDYVDSTCRPLLGTLRELATSQGTALYLVGGPVRDRLLGLPFKDLDFVVEGDAPALARVLAQRIGGRAVIHSRFGTATVSLAEARIDLVTARSEEYPTPGALPNVISSLIRDDLARRDFSINAMALPLFGPPDNILDPMGGRPDLEQCLIRTLHSASFADDPTRLFRAVRYEQRLGFAIETETEHQIKAAVEQDFCDNVSGDRLRHELERIFEEQRPGEALVRAATLGLLRSLVPSIDRVDYVSLWDSMVTEYLPHELPGTLTWLAGLAYPLSRAESESFIRRLNMPSAWARVVRDTVDVRENEVLLSSHDLLPSDLCRTLDGLSLEALYLVAAAANSQVVSEHLRLYLAEYRKVLPVLKGQDLLELGVPEGPMVGDALARLRNARLNRTINSEDEEREWVERLVSLKRPGLAAK